MSSKMHQDMLHAWLNREVLDMQEYCKGLGKVLGETVPENMARFAVSVIKQITL